MDRILVLLRHGQSEWNHKKLFTGWKDPDLTLEGVEEARAAGRSLKARGIFFDRGFTSNLVRAQHTLRLVLAELGTPRIDVTRDRSLNERDYGILCGLNKDDAIMRWGNEQVALWRRSYDARPPGGESLKDTAARVLPYYCQKILPLVLTGQRVIVVGHGNSLGALVMVLDQLIPETTTPRELANGIPLVYHLKPDSTVAARETLEPNRIVA
jgi:2,3-bisphosphoglycerate-dependent phosphoglycerate mutase